MVLIFFLPKKRLKRSEQIIKKGDEANNNMNRGKQMHALLKKFLLQRLYKMNNVR
jgi:hypothetical protein